jgi:hypothetical protein
MAVLPDKHYAATLAAVESGESTAKNFFLRVTCTTADGNVSRDLYVTPEALDKTRDALEALGALEHELADWEWLQNPQSLISGKEVDITTVTKHNQDGTKSWVEILWINSPKRKIVKASAALAQAAAALFGGPQPGPQFGVKSDSGRIGGPMPGREAEPPWAPEPPTGTDDLPF